MKICEILTKFGQHFCENGCFGAGRGIPQPLRSISSINPAQVAVVDSSLISGWEPKSKKWPSFRSNMKEIINGVHAAGGNGHHLQASDLAGIQEKFEEIAALMEDTGLDEHL